MICPPSPRLRTPASATLVALLALGLAAALGPRPYRQSPALAQGTTQTWTRTAVWASGYAPDGLLEPRGVAAAGGGRFLVADSGHDRVAWVDAAGAVQAGIGGLGDGAAQLRAPSDVAVDLGRDRIYVVDAGNRRLSLFRLDGSPVTQWRSGGPTYGFAPHAVAVAPTSGEVYVLSRLPWGFIDRFAPSGQWLGGWGDTGSLPGQMEYPEDLTVLDDGRVAVADTGNGRIQVFGAGGQPVVRSMALGGARALEPGPGGLLLALYPSTGTPGRLDRVAAFDAAGARQADLLVHEPTKAFEPARGLALDRASSRLAVSTGAGAGDRRQGVQQFDLTTGALAAATMGVPAAHPALLRPSALDVAPDGSVVVLDQALGLVARRGPDGSAQGLLDLSPGTDVTVAADGQVYVAHAPVQGTVSLWRLGPGGGRVWEKPCDCLSGLGLAADAGAVYATDAMRRQLTVFDQSPANRSPTRVHRPAQAPYGWLIDLDMGPGGSLWGVGGADRLVHRLDPASGRVVQSWEVAPDQGGERIAVSPEGLVFVLRADGQVAIFDGAGQPAGRITPAPLPGRASIQLRDIAAGPGGRLYAVDAVSQAILVYEPGPAGPAPSATPAADAPCTVTGTKRAAPDILRMGETATVELGLEIRCRPGSQRKADIMLVLDRSSSMSGLKLDSARAAASRFVADLDLSRHQVGLVSFSDLVSLDQPLTRDGAATRAVLDSIRSDGSTDIGEAMDRALAHLAAAGRPDAMPVILLMTDGKPTREGQPYIDALRTAARARGRGALLYVIGLGEDVVSELLVAMAGSAERYFLAPTPDQLAPIYAQLSGSVGEVVATDLVVTDTMGPDVTLEPGSAQPAPAAQTADTVTWRLPVAPAGNLRFTLRVRPQKTGRLPTNRIATASYLAEGQPFSFTFPVPEVLVLDAVPPTRQPDPTTVYLPFLARDACLIKQVGGVDVVLALDTSSSMTGAKLQAAVAAAKVLLGELSERTDRVGLVSFDAAARREYVITQDFEAIARRLDQLALGTGTRIDLGLERSLAELESRGRDGAAKAVILLSDGRPDAGTEGRALDLARLARAGGVAVFTVGLGTDLDSGFLQSLAREPSHAFVSPRPQDLAEIYRRIAVVLPCQ